jgi:predicted ATPase
MNSKPSEIKENNTKRYILTGTPGSGKTSIINALADMSYTVVKESATDVIADEQAKGIAEPWTSPYFVDSIVKLQKQRQINAPTSKIQFFDRSPICTYALSIYLDIKPAEALVQEIKRIKENNIYQKKVFFIENLGFCTPSEARKISFEESLHFEKIHQEVYQSAGYKCIMIPSRTIPERVNDILKELALVITK